MMTKHVHIPQSSKVKKNRKGVVSQQEKESLPSRKHVTAFQNNVSVPASPPLTTFPVAHSFSGQTTRPNVYLNRHPMNTHASDFLALLRALLAQHRSEKSSRTQTEPGQTQNRQSLITGVMTSFG